MRTLLEGLHSLDIHTETSFWGPMVSKVESNQIEINV